MRAATVAAAAVETAVAVATEAAGATAFVHPGGCHCGALRWSLATAKALAVFSPRACDCDFCTRHRAAWVSDPEGSLQLVYDDGCLRRYRQGSGQADFLFCDRCAVLVAVACTDAEGALRAALNRNGFDGRDDLGADVVASPQRLSPDAKRARWLQLWTPATLSRA